MKTSLSYLPTTRQEELKLLASLLQERYSGIEMIILYGSYARGDYVEYDQRVEYGVSTFFQSDYDILIVFNRVDNPVRLSDCIDSAIRRFEFETGSQTIISCICEPIRKFLAYLEEGRYFYTTVKQEGVMLYDSGNYKLPRRKPLRYSVIKKQAEEYYEEWFERGKTFLRLVDSCIAMGDYKVASFNLHQACENFFNVISLVYSLNKPKEHDLKSLIRFDKKYTNEILTVFPMKTPEDRRLFELLRAAYVQSRYNKDFKVTSEDLDALIPIVGNFRDITASICERQIRRFTDLASEQKKKDPFRAGSADPDPE